MEACGQHVHEETVDELVCCECSSPGSARCLCGDSPST
jgi:hypothetical protein